MTKWVVDVVELIKKQYVTDAYTKEAAEEKAHLQPPRTKVSLGEITHSVTPINEYEYNQKWKPQPDYNEGLDWIDEASGRNKRPKKDHEGYQYDAFKDQDLYRDD